MVVCVCVCCLQCVVGVCCSLFAGCWLSAVCCSLRCALVGVCWLVVGVRCSMAVGRCRLWLLPVICSLCVVWCLLSACPCALCVVRCWLLVFLVCC